MARLIAEGIPLDCHHGLGARNRFNRGELLRTTSDGGRRRFPTSSRYGVRGASCFFTLLKAWRQYFARLGPPRTANFLLAALPKATQNDIYNDLTDWYPGWVAEFGKVGADCLYFIKVFEAYVHVMLNVAMRVAKIIGTAKGSK